MNSNHQPSITWSVFNPHVGGLGSGNMITLENAAGKLICRQNRMTTVIFLIGFLFFGPGLAFGAMHDLDRIKEMPLFLAIPIGLLLLIGNYCLLSGIFRNPQIVVDKGSGKISMLIGLNAQVKQVFHRDDIDRLETGIRNFNGKNGTYPNYFLTLVPRSGKPVILCCSPDKAIMDRFQEQLATYTGLEISPAEAHSPAKI